jgi:hypothetical protein
MKRQISTIALLFLSKAAFAQEDQATEKAPEKAAEDKAEDTPATTEETVVEEVDDSIDRGLSWDITAGGVPSGGAIAQVEAGFSAMIRGSYHYTIDPGFSVGGMASLDYGYWAPSIAFAPALLLQAPIRYSLVHNDSMSFGLRADPGLGFFFKGSNAPIFTFGVLLNVSASIGFVVQNRMIIGGGVDFPLVLGINGDRAFLRLPILIGPTLELHATPPLALTLDVKAGPSFVTGGETIFGFRLMAGVAYRM